MDYRLIKKLKFFPILVFIILFNINFLHAEIFHKVKLLKISDGDTFIVLDNGRKIKLRLLYIDTPEKYNSKKLDKQAKKCYVSKKKIKKLGRLASKYAKQYFKGQKYILVYYKGKGHYRRTLAVVKRLDRETTYNYDVIKDGYACIYRWAYYPDEYMKAYKIAEKEKKGLWGNDSNLMKCICEK